MLQLSTQVQADGCMPVNVCIAGVTNLAVHRLQHGTEGCTSVSACIGVADVAAHRLRHSAEACTCVIACIAGVTDLVVHRLHTEGCTCVSACIAGVTYVAVHRLQHSTEGCTCVSTCIASVTDLAVHRLQHSADGCLAAEVHLAAAPVQEGYQRPAQLRQPLYIPFTKHVCGLLCLELLRLATTVAAFKMHTDQVRILCSTVARS